MVFLRTGAVVVQVIPWGEDGALRGGVLRRPGGAHGDPARLVQYRRRGEHAVRKVHGKDHPVITDPDVFYRNGSNARFYQNIQLNTTRFAPTLEMVTRMLRD
ncbi:unnamed protein product [Urochloa humidicola]